MCKIFKERLAVGDYGLWQWIQYAKKVEKERKTVMQYPKNNIAIGQ